MIYTPYPRVGYLYKANWSFQEDFGIGEAVSGRIGTHGWNGAGTLSNVNGVTDHPGIINVSSTAVQDTVGRLNMLGGAVFSPTHEHGCLWVVRVNHADVNTLVRVGVSNAWATSPADHTIVFERLTTDTNWFCVNRASATQTRVDSGVAMTTGWVTLAYYRFAGGVSFYINDTYITTITTNIPSTVGGFGAHIRNSEASAKTMDIDYVEGFVTGMVRA